LPATGGSITLSPAGGVYAPNTTVTATAVASAGFGFAGWGGSLSGTKNPQSFVVNANKTISASFVQPPVADFSATPLSGTAPLAVAFTDLSTRSPTQWLWSFGDGGTSTAKSPSYSYPFAGVYNVSLTATNAGGSNQKTRNAYVSVAAGVPQQVVFASADARVSFASPTSNYGKDTALRVRGGTAPYETFLAFDLTPLAGKSVVSAKLWLFVTDPSRSGGSVYAVAGGWTETGITWATAPAITGTPLATAGAVTDGTWVSYDVTPAVPSTGTVYFGLTSTETDSAYFSSREGSEPPRLVIQTGP